MFFNCITMFYLLLLALGLFLQANRILVDGNPTLDLMSKLYGRQYKFQSYNFRSHYMRHYNFKVSISPYSSSQIYQLDSAWNIVPGSCGRGISFQSKNYPDHLIRHYGFIAYIHKMSNQGIFRQDACFIPRPGLADPHHVSFESMNFPGYFLRHQSFVLKISRRDGTDLFRKDATWIPQQLKDRSISGKWHLTYGNKHLVTNGEYTLKKEIGVEVGKEASVAHTVSFNWKYGLEMSTSLSFLGVDIGLKTMFEVNGMKSALYVSRNTWKKMEKTTETQSYNLVEGKPFYLWQWYYKAHTTDGAYIVCAANLYATSNGTVPGFPN